MPAQSRRELKPKASTLTANEMLKEMIALADRLPPPDPAVEGRSVVCRVGTVDKDGILSKSSRLMRYDLSGKGWYALIPGHGLRITTDRPTHWNEAFPAASQIRRR